MCKKLVCAIFAVLIFSVGVANAQIVNFRPSTLNLDQSDGLINDTFDISGLFSQPTGTSTLTITNGNITSDDNWTVGEFDPTTFTVDSSVGLGGVVLHGANLGSEAQQNGSDSRDGLIATTGETWTLVSNLDDDYATGVEGNLYYVDYVGEETNQLESNSSGFRWESDGNVSQFQVFSNNTIDLNNNFTVLLEGPAAIPEPASAMLLGMGTCLLMLHRRRRKS